MNKKDLIERTQKSLSFLSLPKKSSAATIVETVLNELKKMIKEEEVRVKGFGTFKVKRRSEYTIYPPSGPKTVPAREIVKFKCSRNFFEEGVNEDKV